MMVYVAGSSDERERAKKWMKALRDAGVEVTSTWCETIDGEQHGAANPRDATLADRNRWAIENVIQIQPAGIIWVLVPGVGHGRGAYFEMGWAYGMGKLLVSSGLRSGHADTRQSVFTALGREFSDDAEAFEFVVAHVQCEEEEEL